MSRRPTPRTQRTVPNPFIVFLLTAIIAAFISVMAYHVYTNRRPVQNTTAPITFFGAVGTVQDGGDIRIYTWTDPDSNRTYLVTDRGGICERNLEVIGE